MNDRRAPSILLVDDEPAVLMSHAAILERLGYKITQADTAEHACQALSRVQFDLLICDLSLNGASGLDVIAEALRYNPSLPVVLMTGYGHTPLPNGLADAKITIVAKPTSIPAFLDTIKRLLHGGNGSDRTQAAD